MSRSRLRGVIKAGITRLGSARLGRKHGGGKVARQSSVAKCPLGSRWLGGLVASLLSRSRRQGIYKIKGKGVYASWSRWFVTVKAYTTLI